MTNDPETLGEVSHTNPYTGQVFGRTQTYSRGTTVAADGGEPDAGGDTDVDEEDAETLADLSHEAPEADDADGTQRTFNRGERE